MLRQAEKKINEINTSIYCYDTSLLFGYLAKISPVNKQHEFYLTDIIEKLSGDGRKITVVQAGAGQYQQVEGINDRIQLARAEKIMQKKINEGLMAGGVTFRDPESVFISPEVRIARDCLVEPGCLISGHTDIGGGCVIGPFSQIEDSRIGKGSRINKSVIQGSVIGDFNIIGPTSYIRPGTATGSNVKIGACCEIKKSRIASNSKVPHLSYIGDADIGSRVNVGAGTVTCNYDGFLKNKTIVGDGVFIGSDTMLVAPVKVGKGAITAAGSVVSEDVPANSLAIERNKQVNIPDGAVRFREKKEKQKVAGKTTKHDHK